MPPRDIVSRVARLKCGRKTRRRKKEIEKEI
jgi:hypothetical protein